jgi:ABC-2 type transport system permease protein
MKALLKLTWMETKLFLREPQAFFFTLIFPLMLLFVFGSINGNTPRALFGGFGTVDVSVPSYSAMIIATSGLISIPIIIATYRETGILRRFKCTPLSPLTLLMADVTVILAMTAVGMLLLILAAKLVFGLRFSGSYLSIAVAFLLGCISFFSLGFILAGLIRTARTAQIVGMALFFPMILLSGATIPLETMPAALQSYVKFLPLSFVVRLLKGLWFGQDWLLLMPEVIVLVAMSVIGIALTAMTFRWD